MDNVETTDSLETGVQPDTQPVAATAAPAELALWDSPESFENDEWVKGLDAPRRDWLTKGIRSSYDKYGELEAGLSDSKAAAAAAKTEAERWLKMLEAANPDFKDLRQEVEDLRQKSAAAEQAAVELERLKTENAGLAELRAALASHETAAQEAGAAMKAVQDELAALKSTHEGFVNDSKTQTEALVGSYASALENTVAAAFKARFPEATPKQVQEALEAWDASFPEGDQTPVEQQLNRAYAAMAAVMPRPDAVPRSVQAMSAGAASGRGLEMADSEIATRFYADKRGDDGRKLASELGLTLEDLVKRVARASGRRG